MTDAGRPWWSHPGYAAALVLLMAVPLLWPAMPPLSDLPVHMGRYRIQAGMDGAPTLAEAFSIHWMPVGNLGVDVLVLLLGPALGIEFATKLVVLAIPMLTAAGMLFVAAEIHGRIPPTAAFALPLAYGYPFQFGFVNYALSVALALLAFGLALRLARQKCWRARAALLLVGGIVIYFSHVMGWGVFGLLCVAEAAVRRLKEPGGVWHAARGVAADCLPLAVPLLFILIWRGEGGGGAISALFDLRAKWGGLESALRERWVGWDGYCALGLLGVFLVCAARPFRLDPRLAAALAALGVLYLCLPYAFFGLIYADARIAPLLLAIALLSLRPREGLDGRVMTLAAVAALVFFAARIAVTTVSMGLYASEQERNLEALEALPNNSRVLALVDLGCPRGWAPPRITIASMAIVRRDSFVNDQFRMPGAQLVRVGPSIPADFAYEDSGRIRLPGCDRPEPLLADRLAAIPRDRFDHVWVLGVPRDRQPHESWLRPLWTSEQGALYRIVPPGG